MKGCARVLATISLFLFVLTATLAIILINVRQHLLSPQTYSQALDLEGVYDELPALVADQLRYSISFNPCLEDSELCDGGGPPENSEEGGSGFPGYFVAFPEQVWEGVISALIETSWMEDQIEAVLDQVFSILTEETPSDVIAISLEGINDRMQGETGFQVIIDVINTQPACTSDQLNVLTQAFTSDGLIDAMIQCKPPQELMNLVEPKIRSALGEIVGMLPSSVEFEIPTEITSPRRSAATILSIARGAFKFAPWIALFWLFAISVFVVRDLRSWLGWWGTGLFMTGFCTLAFGLTLEPIIEWSLGRMILSQGVTAFSPTLIDTALRVANNIRYSFSLRLMTQAGILLGVGLLMLIIRLMLRSGSNGQIGTRLTEPRSY